MAKLKKEVAPEVAPEEVTTTEEVAQEVPLNPETQVVPDVTPTGHHSRDFSA